MQCGPPPDPPPLPPPNPGASNAGGWALAALVVSIVVIEVWLIVTHRPTMSQWLQRRLRRVRHRGFWSFLAASLLGVLLWHLVIGGPL